MSESPISEPVAQTAAQINARVISNLDTAEREGKKEPFSFVHHGRQIMLEDPGELDWQVVENFQSERDFLKAAMSDEDLGYFLSVPTPLWKIDKLARDYQAHYGVEEPGKAD